MASLLSFGKGSLVLAFLLSTALPSYATPSGAGILPPGPSLSFDNTHSNYKREEGLDAVLKPALHWGHDLEDRNHLVPRTQQKMFYAEHNDATKPAQIAFANFDLEYPSVALEHSSSIKSVSCSCDTSMTIEFACESSFEHARTHWTGYGGEKGDKMAFIGYFEGCSPSFQIGARSFSVVHDLKFHRKGGAFVVDAVVDHVDVKKAIKRAVFDMGSYKPRKQDEGRAEADFGEFGMDFDQKLDKELELRSTAVRTPLIKRWNPFEAIVNLVNEVKDKGKQFFDTAKAKLEEFGENLKQGAKEFADKIKIPFVKPHTLEKFKTVSVDHSNADEDTPFGNRKGHKVGELFGITLFCVECAIKGEATFGGSLTFSIAHGIEEGYLSFDGKLKASVALGIVNTNPYIWIPVYSYTRRLWEQGIPGLSVPGLYSIGPKLVLDLELDFGVGFTGQLALGFEMEWQRAMYRFDFKDSSKTTSDGWKPTINPIVDIHGNLSINAALGYPIGIAFGVSLFNEPMAEVRLAEKPTITTWLKQEVNLEYIKDTAPQDLDAATKANKELGGHFVGNVTGAGKCPGAVFSLMISMDTILSFTIMKFSKLPILPIYLFRGILYEREDCLKFGIFTKTAEKLKKARRSFTKAVRGIISPRKANFELTNVMCASEVLTLAHGDNGGCYIDTTPEDNDAEDDAYKFATDSNGYVIGDSQDRLFRIFEEEIEDNAVARLRLSKEENAPRGTSPIIFAPDEFQGIPVLLGYSSKFKLLYPIACSYTSQPPKLFVAKNLNEGLNKLRSNTMQKKLTGGEVTSCQFIAWKTGQMANGSEFTGRSDSDAAAAAAADSEA